MELEEVERLRKQFEEEGTTSSLLAYEAALFELLDEVEYVECLPCPVCGGPQTFIGALGSRNHYQCRDCGLNHSNPVEPKGDALGEED
jgi:hypothetical protein